VLVNVPTVDTVYINLDDRPDLDARMRELLREYRSVTRLPATVWSLPAAVSMSHRRALDHNADDKPLLILEDDCVPFEPRALIEVPDDADIVYLGISSIPYLGNPERKEDFIKPYEPVDASRDVWRAYGSLLTHAVLYLTPRGREYMRAVCDFAIKVNGPHDFYVAESLFTVKAYALNSPFFAQSSQFEVSNGTLDFFYD